MKSESGCGRYDILTDTYALASPAIRSGKLLRIIIIIVGGVGGVGL